LIAPYFPKAGGGSGEHIEGQVVRKQRDGNRLLVKITTAQGPILVAFNQKVADLDVLLEPGDTVTLMMPGYATFVEDPVFERIKAPSPAKPPA
jgi:TOBE domain-containing protein